MFTTRDDSCGLYDLGLEKNKFNEEPKYLLIHFEFITETCDTCNDYDELHPGEMGSIVKLVDFEISALKAGRTKPIISGWGKDCKPRIRKLNSTKYFGPPHSRYKNREAFIKAFNKNNDWELMRANQGIIFKLDSFKIDEGIMVTLQFDDGTSIVDTLVL